MGCDIHLLVELRSTYKGEAGKWERVLPPPAYRETPWQVARGKEEWAELSPWSAVGWATRWYAGRNYRLFAMLADVRNGRGFAGVQTGDGFTPIAQPKGWPTDPGPEVAAFIAASRADVCYPVPDGDVYPGDHTPSWLTLRELDAYDWTGQTTRQCGVISLLEYAARRERGDATEPASYCGDISGPGIVTIDEPDAEARLRGAGIVEVGDQRMHVRAWWETTYADAAGDFYTRVLPGLRSLVRPSGDFITTPDDIRIVFNFDS